MNDLIEKKTFFKNLKSNPIKIIDNNQISDSHQNLIDPDI